MNDAATVALDAAAMTSGLPAAPLFPFDNSYARLPERFFARLAPAPVAAPGLVRINRALAAELGLDADRLASPEGVAVLAGSVLPAGAEPIAMAYAGHQFGGFSPSLGDGRALLLGEIVDRDGARRDIQLKGSGPTPFSRRGDGRAALGPVLREYIVGEAMHALGVATTRALAAVTTGEPVYRETVLPGAVLTRVAASHVRVGTFQYFAARGDEEALRLLADHVIARHHPDLAGSAEPYRALLEAIIARQATLIAQWLSIGFIHGVMNTDNMTVSGETIDYGPCAFMDHFEPGKVLSSIDDGGRYAYDRQPHIGAWNLTRLAEAMLPLLATDETAAIAVAEEALAAYGPRFDEAHKAAIRAKLGLDEALAGDVDLIRDLFALMADAKADFTNLFRALPALVEPALPAADPHGQSRIGGLFPVPEQRRRLAAWGERWGARLAEEGATIAGRAAAMRAVNPLFIPRNHLIEEVITAAVGTGDLAPFERLLAVVERPFAEQRGHERYAAPPSPEQEVRATFCGT